MPTATSTPESLLRRLDWHVVRRLDGLLEGDYRTLLYGHGVDFADLREYLPGDDVRRIDWNVTARTNITHVRQYVDDRATTTWFLLDRSPSMAFGDAERPKSVVLTELVTTLARVLTREGNRVGAILYDNAVERVIEPRAGRNQVLRIARELLRPAPSSSHAPTDLQGLLRSALLTIRRRSLVFVVSDFISEPGWDQTLGVLARRHEIVAFRLWDPREVELPDAGLIAVEDAETGEQLFVDSSDPELRSRVRDLGDARVRALTRTVRRAGADIHDVSTGDDLVRTLAQVVQRRKRRR